MRIMLTTEEHDESLRWCNAVKGRENAGREGGAFYINEFFDVLVPDGKGGACFWAGTYDGLLEFRDGNLRVSPVPENDVLPGDLWRGPHGGSDMCSTPEQPTSGTRWSMVGVAQRTICRTYTVQRQLVSSPAVSAIERGWQAGGSSSMNAHTSSRPSMPMAIWCIGISVRSTRTSGSCRRRASSAIDRLLQVNYFEPAPMSIEVFHDETAVAILAVCSLQSRQARSTS